MKAKGHKCCDNTNNKGKEDSPDVNSVNNTKWYSIECTYRHNVTVVITPWHNAVS